MVQTKFVDVEDIISKNEIYYAHINGMESTKSPELLVDHINLCHDYYVKICEHKHIEETYKRIYKQIFVDSEYYDFFKLILDSIITFHDLGKTNPKFQRDKMLNQYIKDVDFGIGSKHSILSSLIFIDYFIQKLNYEYEYNSSDADHLMLVKIIFAISFVITRHHSDMSDFIGADSISYISDFELNMDMSNLYKEYLNCEWLFNLEYTQNYEIKIENILDAAYDVGSDYNQENNGTIYILMRLMYSILVASDYYATTEYMDGRKTNFDRWSIEEFKSVYYNSDLIKSIREKEVSKSYLIDQDMNDIRTEIFLEVERAYEEDKSKNIYFLESPTGSGKSNAAMNLSYKMLEGQRDKIIYAYPFNTLVEQNKKTLEHIYSKSEFRKYISTVNSITKIKTQDEEEDYIIDYNKILLDRQFLHDPFIITSNVNLFNILFSNKRADIFGLYQLANSVIVLDEIQAYKSKIWIEIIEQLDLYSKLFNMKFIIMSATLPDLSTFLSENKRISKLVKDPKKLFKNPLFMKRVEICYELLDIEEIKLDIIKNHMSDNIKNYNKVLVEFIFKKRAEEFYNLIVMEDEFSDYEVILLTGDDNLHYRNKVIDKAKHKDTKIILIATQVIEAGVDIDMDIGYKDISIFENEEQFLGRINRSCKKDGSKAFFFDLDNEKLIYGHDSTGYSTLRNLERRKDLINKDFSNYYRLKLNSIYERKVNLTGYEQFVKDRDGLNFKKVAEHMKLIDDGVEKQRYYFAREIETEDGIIDGRKVWARYKELLMDDTINYSEKYVELFNLRVDMNLFIYELDRHANISYQEVFGNIRYIEDSDKYFQNGRFINKMESELFI